MAQKGDIDLEAWRLPLTEGWGWAKGLAMIATSRRIGLGEGFGDWLVHFTNNALRMTNTNQRRRRGLTRPEGTRGLAIG
jgi:hypothetical protein